MLYKEIIAICGEIHKKNMNNTVWTENNIFFFNFKLGGT